jgi:hypothetical protein
MQFYKWVHVASVTGVDISQGMLTQAAARVAAQQSLSDKPIKLVQVRGVPTGYQHTRLGEVLVEGNVLLSCEKAHTHGLSMLVHLTPSPSCLLCCCLLRVMPCPWTLLIPPPWTLYLTPTPCVYCLTHSRHYRCGASCLMGGIACEPQQLTLTPTQTLSARMDALHESVAQPSCSP